ncbi:MAG: hypothetical protein IKS60_00090 [Lachnospiraceae bacterium]|nr:hypothetical protein [Lachnospiraceae bacterium]MBR5916856.1 hypothetical protein [Lachnospiraceae bacterium]
MSNAKLKKINNVISVVSIVLLLIALLFGFSILKIGVQNLVAEDNVNIDIESSANTRQAVKGTIISITATTTEVSYVAEGNELTSELQVYADEFKVGDSVDVYYAINEPRNVNNIRVPELFIAYYHKMGTQMVKIGLLIIGVCGGIGLVLFIIALKMRKKIGNN